MSSPETGRKRHPHISQEAMKAIASKDAAWAVVNKPGAQGGVTIVLKKGRAKKVTKPQDGKFSTRGSAGSTTEMSLTDSQSTQTLSEKQIVKGNRVVYGKKC